MAAGLKSAADLRSQETGGADNEDHARSFFICRLEQENAMSTPRTPALTDMPSID
jgi:hypothetical protein